MNAHYTARETPLARPSKRRMHAKRFERHVSSAASQISQFLKLIARDCQGTLDTKGCCEITKELHDHATPDDGIKRTTAGYNGRRETG